MNPKQSKLKHQSQEEHAAETQATSETKAAREFATVEDLLRHDAERTPGPPAVEQRLTESIRSEPEPPRSWWHRLFPRKSPEE
jgi:hypothetical protein